jgi:hypothetical protein
MASHIGDRSLSLARTCLGRDWLRGETGVCVLQTEEALLSSGNIELCSGFSSLLIFAAAF